MDPEPANFTGTNSTCHTVTENTLEPLESCACQLQDRVTPCKAFLLCVVFLSTVCLLIMTILFIFFIERRRLPCKILFCFQTSLLFTYIIFAPSLVVPVFGWSKDVCYILAVASQFGYISSILWLNVMAIDIWRTFSNLRPPEEVERTGNKFLVYYAIFAYFTAGILAAIEVTLDNVELLPVGLRPNFGANRCWLGAWSRMLPSLLYLHTPVAIVMLTNIALFSRTVHVIKVIKDEVILKDSTLQRNMLTLYTRLSLTMGISWIFVCIPWTFIKVVFVWHIFDAFYAMQGCFVFLVFFITNRSSMKVVKTGECFCGLISVYKFHCNA